MEIIRWNIFVFVIIKEILSPVECQYPGEMRDLGASEAGAAAAEDLGELAPDDFTEHLVPAEAGEAANIGETAKPPIGGKLSLNIKDSGVMDLHRGDTALIFYITALNTGSETVQLSVEEKRCCQKIASTDEDCESITLIGGDMGELHPGDIRNLTLFYPNMYLHDRVGFCEVDIISETEATMQYKLHFDTTLPRRGGRVPRLLQQYYTPSEMSTCQSVDENPLNDCLPAYCHMKYNGQRNFFNHTSRRCEKIPECVSEQESDLPEIVYVPISNKCRKLSDHLTEEDLTWFQESEKAETLAHLHSYPMNVRCNKGRPNPENGWCDCEPGWASASFDHATFNPDTMVYHMCTIWTGSGKAPEAEGIEKITEEEPAFVIIILSVLSAILLLVVIVFVICFYIQRRRREKKTTRDGNVTSDTDECLLRD